MIHPVVGAWGRFPQNHISINRDLINRRCPAKLAPGRLWDIGLWVSSAGLLIAGGYAFYTNVIFEFIGKSGG